MSSLNTALATELNKPYVTPKILEDMLQFMKLYRPTATAREFNLAGCCSFNDADAIADLFVAEGLFQCREILSEDKTPVMKAYRITKAGINIEFAEMVERFKAAGCINEQYNDDKRTPNLLLSREIVTAAKSPVTAEPPQHNTYALV